MSGAVLLGEGARPMTTERPGGMTVLADHNEGNEAMTNSATIKLAALATWAMMIGGFGLVGGAMRRRQRRVRTAVRFA